MKMSHDDAPGMTRSFFRFSLVGAVVAGINFALLWLFKRIVPELVAVAIAYFLAVAVHFTLNKLWVFGSRTTVRGGELARYVLMVVTCALCTSTMVWLVFRFLTKNVFVANALALVPATLLSFLLMRRFVFR
jgi:putative flippase GtrA